MPRFTPLPAEAGGGIVTVALVLASRRTGVTRYLALVELGLSSARPVARPSRGHPAASLTHGFYGSRREHEGIQDALCSGVPGVAVLVVAAAVLAIVDLDDQRPGIAGHMQQVQPHAGRRRRNPELSM